MIPTQDPVSGNAVPPGALPAEVRDDQPIMASEGEYVIPADVVRYIGLEKIEALVNGAKKGLAEKMAQGRIGGKEMPPQGGPAQMPPQAPQQMPPRGPVGMAEGGMVAPQNQGYMRTYRGADGRLLYVPFFNGQPLVPIPEGFQPVDQGTLPTPAPTQPTRPNSQSSGSSRRDEQPASPARGIADWDVSDFVSFGNRLESGAHDMIGRGIEAVVPFGGVLTALARRDIDRNMPALLDGFIESGVDRQGNPITEEAMQNLVRTRETLRSRIAEESNQKPNPFERITDYVARALTGGPQGVATMKAGQTPTSRTAGTDRGISFSSATPLPQKPTASPTPSTTSPRGIATPRSDSGDDRPSTRDGSSSSPTPRITVSGSGLSSKPAGYTPVGGGTKGFIQR